VEIISRKSFGRIENRTMFRIDVEKRSIYSSPDVGQLLVVILGIGMARPAASTIPHGRRAPKSCSPNSRTRMRSSTPFNAPKAIGKRRCGPPGQPGTIAGAHKAANEHFEDKEIENVFLILKKPPNPTDIEKNVSHSCAVEK